MLKIKSLLAKPFAALIHKKVRKDMNNAVETQQQIFQHLIETAKSTKFGRDHNFESINSYSDYKQQVPIRDYEALKPYIEEVKQGKENILWPGKPLYFAKTSGTTSGAKYIPITKDSIPNHINTARNALLCYMKESGNYSFADGKMIFLSGSPVLDKIAGINTGRLSGIVNHFVPGYLRGNQLPSYETNCIEDWEEKLGKVVEETINQDMRLISGIPPWVQMYFDWLIQKSGKSTIKEIFPNLSVIVQGGVNFEPYKAKMMQTIGGQVDILETFPASEGFFAFQDTLTEPGLLLNTNSGIFFEFIPADEIHNENPTRLSLAEVEVNKNYALIINSNAGLWGYNIGDMVRFISTNPYRLVVSGRVKHYISAFGEHVIGEEVEYAILKAAEKHPAHIVEFTVAPMVNTDGELPYHEWYIEFEKQPDDMHAFALEVDNALRSKNSYYEDLISGGILQPLKINTMRPRTFIEYMKSQGKLGGQNKVPRLSNDRKLADALHSFIIH